MNWKVQESPCAGRWEVRGDGVKVVAQLIGTKEQATLLAAAPELLARLKSMVSGAECECDKGDEEHPLCDICWSRQVIAKAEGRSE